MLRMLGCLTLMALLSVGCSGSKDDAASTAERAKPQTPPPTIPTSSPTDEGLASDAASDPSDATSAQAESSSDTALAANDPKAQKPATPKAEKPAIQRTSSAGRWIMFLNQQLHDFPIALVEIKQDDQGQFQAAVLEGTRAFPAKPEIESAAIDENSVDIQFQLPDAKFDFEGRLADNRIRGNFLFESGRTFVGWLEPTEEESIAQTRPINSEGAKDLQNISDENRVEGLRKFVQDHPNGPLALIAYQILLQSAKDDQLDAAATEALINDYVQKSAPWGKRMELQARINAGMTLARKQHLPELAVATLKQAQKNLPEDAPADWKSEIERELTILGLQTGTDEEKKQAAEALAALQKKNGFDHRVTLALAEYAEQAGQTDQAIEQNARLSVLPSQEEMIAQEWLQEGIEKPLPSETLARLWKEKHGSTDGLEDYLNQVYEDAIYEFASSEKVEPRSGDNHAVALVELFTGAQCPPCVAADVAAGGIEAVYPESDVIVLRYHQHIPGPDPLTNAVSEARFDYYSGQGTPTVALNGAVVDGFGGFLEHSVSRFQRLRQLLDEALARETPIDLKLSANAENGQLTVSAEATGLENPDANLRLRLVLAEDKVEYLAPNGIRVHEMVVRDMPTGAAGVPPQDGALKFSHTSSLASLKQQLIDYLAAFEAGQQANFPVKPLDLTKLHLVAFVQDDGSKEVLQAAAIPVSGNLEYPADLKPTTAAAKPSPNADASDEGAGEDGQEPASDGGGTAAPQPPQ